MVKVQLGFEDKEEDEDEGVVEVGDALGEFATDLREAESHVASLAAYLGERPGGKREMPLVGKVCFVKIREGIVLCLIFF